jgi:exodeoxyribonuclease III
MKYTFRLLALCALFLVHTSFKKPPPFTIITYNVWNGFESETPRRNAFVAWAQWQQADVIAFQELNHFTQTSFAALAKSWGHPYAVIVKENGYPVGISSKYPITNVYKQIAGMHHGCLYAEIKGISFFVVHFSPFSSAKRLEEAKGILQTLQAKNKLSGKVIVLGDFNAFSPVDSVFYSTSAVRDSMYAAETKNSILRNLNEQQELDYAVIRSFLQQGFYDSFSLTSKKFDASYPTKVFPGTLISGQVKIDQVLLSAKMKVRFKSAAIIKDAVTDTLSDHYPIRETFIIP